MFKTFIVLLFCVASIQAINTYINATTYVYKTVDDLQIELDVYVPLVAPPKTGYPVFFAVHGGAWIFGHKKAAFTEQEFNETMDRGWVMVSIDYRLSPGVVLHEMMVDIQDAYDWVRSKLVDIVPINPDLITLFGQSAGGGLVTTAAYKLIPRPTAVLSFYPGFNNWTALPSKANSNKLIVAAAKKLRVPVTSTYSPTKGLLDPRVQLLIAAYELKQLPWLMATLDPNLPNAQVVELLRDFSATENVDKDFPPTYLAHGTKDKTVNFTQSQQLADQLKLHNVPYVFDLIPGADHVFDYNATNATWTNHVLPAFDFAEYYMGSTKRVPMKLAFEAYRDLIMNFI